MKRKLWIGLNAIIIFLGYQGIKHTDFYNPDPFYSITLPLLDILYLAYLLFLVVYESYKRTWR